jgi:signal transduction histidine kinase
MSQEQGTTRELDHFEIQVQKKESLSDGEQLNFILQKTSQYIEAVIDEGLRIAQLMSREESKSPEEMAGIEKRIEQRLRKKERIQKKLLTEYLLNFQMQVIEKDLSSEQDVFSREAKRIESQLARAVISQGESEARYENRDRLLAIVSHDLRSPLTSIFMGAEVIRTSIDEKTADISEILKLTKMIERNAGLMDRLIRDLMDAERISHGKLSLNREDHRVAELLHYCHEDFVREAQAKGVDLQLQTEDEHIIVHFDFDRMVQALSNLISNGIKFTPKGGQVLVGCQAFQKSVRISVRDSGPGIPERERAHIFERFSQLKSNDQRGLGLGLFIAKWIVEAHHGKIEVESSVGQGSCFSISLPADLVH